MFPMSMFYGMQFKSNHHVAAAGLVDPAIELNRLLVVFYINKYLQDKG